MKQEPEIRAYCMYCKDPIYEDDDFAVMKDKFLHISCYNVIDNECDVKEYYRDYLTE